jgi:hypothetical protein
MKKRRRKGNQPVSAMLAPAVRVTTPNGQTVFTVKAPFKMRKVDSDKQVESNDRFTMAHQYAEGQMTVEARKAAYSKRISETLTSAHAVAHRDYMVAPVVHYIKSDNLVGKVGEVFTIKAVDDFRVESVVVEIRDRAGKILETGNAERVKTKPQIWKYTTTKVNGDIKTSTIKATAKDMPGNIGQRVDTMETVIENGRK